MTRSCRVPPPRQQRAPQRQNNESPSVSVVPPVLLPALPSPRDLGISVPPSACWAWWRPLLGGGHRFHRVILPSIIVQDQSSTTRQVVPGGPLMQSNSWLLRSRKCCFVSVFFPLDASNLPFCFRQLTLSPATSKRTEPKNRQSRHVPRSSCRRYAQEGACRWDKHMM